MFFFACSKVKLFSIVIFLNTKKTGKNLSPSSFVVVGFRIWEKGWTTIFFPTSFFAVVGWMNWDPGSATLVFTSTHESSRYRLWEIMVSSHWK
jgi:hypothetical protein